MVLATISLFSASKQVRRVAIYQATFEPRTLLTRNIFCSTRRHVPAWAQKYETPSERAKLPNHRSQERWYSISGISGRRQIFLGRRVCPTGKSYLETSEVYRPLKNISCRCFLIQGVPFTIIPWDWPYVFHTSSMVPWQDQRNGRERAE